MRGGLRAGKHGGSDGAKVAILPPPPRQSVRHPRMPPRRALPWRGARVNLRRGQAGEPPASTALPDKRTADAPVADPSRPPARRNLVSSLLSLSRLIDRLNERVGHVFYWLVLATVLISAANAVVRKAFNYSSNAWLEIQWYLFSAIFLFLAGYTLLRNDHVRIDVVAGRFSKRV